MTLHKKEFKKYKYLHQKIILKCTLKFGILRLGYLGLKIPVVLSTVVKTGYLTPRQISYFS